MKSYLLPYRCQKAGWWLAGVSLVTFVVWGAMTQFSMQPILTQMPQWLVEPFVWCWHGLPYLAMMLICLSREKDEDEYISSIRARIVFVLVAISFIVAMFHSLYMFIGVRLYDIYTVHSFIMSTRIFSFAELYGLAFIVVFKSILLVNKLKASYNGQ